MKHDPEIQVDLTLIGKYLAGEASPEEAMALDDWKARSAGHQELFEEASRIWENAGPPVFRHAPQADEEWSRLQAALEPSGRGLPVWKIAAGFLIVAGLAVLGYFLLKSPADTQPRLSFQTKENTVTDTLPDRSIVTLAPGSYLTIGKQFSKRQRMLQLKSGEGYFTVRPLSKIPFTVYAGDVKITVLGTLFNVSNDPALVAVAVTTGKVKMERDAQSIIVNGGSTGIYNKRTGTLNLYKDSLDENSYSYATGILDFNNMDLSGVKRILEKTYHVHIYFKDPSLEDLRIHTQFNHQSLSYVLEVIGASLNIQYRVQGNNVYFFEQDIQ